MLKRLLLGPQRPTKNLGQVFSDADFPAGPVAVISAGWQEAEGYIDDVHELVQRPLLDLGLYNRAEAVFAADAELHAAHRERQDHLKDLQRLYRLRLRCLMMAARQLGRSDADPAMVDAEQRHAISQLRELDRHHLKQIASIHAEFDDRIGNSNSAILAENVAGIQAILSGCETVLITGGNVVVLLNRLRLFDVGRLLSGKNLIAWSAGAMVLSDLIVLFHDRTPVARRDPEVFSTGAGVLPGYIFLPDATRRLKVNDSLRMGLIYRRFAPATSMLLDSGSFLQFDDDACSQSVGVKRLTRKGRLSAVRTS
jgi:hypothetical protein